MNVKNLERYFNGRIDWEMGGFVDTVEDRFENALWTAIESVNTP